MNVERPEDWRTVTAGGGGQDSLPSVGGGQNLIFSTLSLRERLKKSIKLQTGSEQGGGPRNILCVWTQFWFFIYDF